MTDDQIEEHMTTPTGIYTTPADIMAATLLTNTEKRDLLHDLKADSKALSRAADESMNGGDNNQLQAVENALIELDADKVSTPPLFRRILIALPSNMAEAAAIAKVGLSMAQSDATKIKLVSFIQPVVPITSIPPIAAPMGAVTVELSEINLAERQKMLKQILSTHNRRYHAEQSVRYGPPAREIEAEAEDWGADLIILGAGEKNWLERLVDPSVSNQVVRAARCAVMILPLSIFDTLDAKS
jgi:nucleotide-binding universal stress UspA family protein